ncbi:MAG: cupredoxin domain-containing protein [Gaiellaceae bacterium]
MQRFTPGALAAVATALMLAAPAGAATTTIQIKSTGFSPSALTINHGDKITWHNADKADHQVVADDGSFASPILKAGQSYTATLANAGTFSYHDSLSPRHGGKLTVKGPPPSVTLSEPIVDYGTQVTLSGAVSTGAANQSVELDQQLWGQASPTQIAIVKTGAGGTFSYSLLPTLLTTYTARWNNTASGSVLAQVSPKMHLLLGTNGYMKATVSAPMSMASKHVFLQRLSPFGQWVNVAALKLGPLSGRLFKPLLYVPKGTSHIRVFLSVNQAGNGLLSAHSGTQTVRRVR